MRTLVFQGYLWSYLLMNIGKTATVKKLNKQGKVKEKNQLIDNIVMKCTTNLIKITGAEVSVTGTENVPVDEPVLYVGNHQSNMDIPLLYTTAPQSMSFVAKKEIEKIPMLNYWMKEKNCVFLDRENARESLKAINQAIDILKSGHSMAIFPEGKRSKGPLMGDFKAGSLRIAIKAGVKVVPVSIKDSYKLMEEKGKVVPAHVSVHYSKPIDSRDFKDTQSLSEAVIKQIKNHI